MMNGREGMKLLTRILKLEKATAEPSALDYATALADLAADRAWTKAEIANLAAEIQAAGGPLSHEEALRYLRE